MAVYKKLGIIPAFLPENMTAILQPMDLLVNGPLKRNQRNINAKDIVKEFHIYHENVKTHIQNHPGVPPGKFKPSRSKLYDGILNLLKQFDDNNAEFNSVKYKNNLKKCFQDTGCSPINDKMEFIQYSEKKAIGGTTLISKVNSIIDLTVEKENLPIEEVVEEYSASLQHEDDEQEELEDDRSEPDVDDEEDEDDDDEEL
jgi:hypothetical protein